MSSLGLQLNDLYFIGLIGACAIALQQASADGSRDAPIYALLDWSSDKMTGRDRVNAMVNFVGLFIDYFILHLHYNNAYHPRFYMNARGRFFIILHLTSGSLEIFLLNLALFVNDFAQIVQVAALVAIFGHAISSFYHTPGCMGSKRMAVSGYAMVICLHTYVAYEVLLDPTNVTKMILLNCVIHTYAWVRANIGLFIWFDMFQNSRYSVSMSWAVFMMLSSFGSPALTFAFLGGVAFWCFLMQTIQPYFPGLAWLADKHDVDYGLAMTSVESARKVLGKNLPDHWDELTDRGQALQVFMQFDKDKKGEIDIAEAKGLMDAMGLPTSIAVEYVTKFDSRKTGKLSFDDFYDMLWTADNVKERLTADFALMSGALIPPRSAPEKEKAKCVFNLIDLDNNGVLSVSELAALLDSWGMPFPEKNAKAMVEKTAKPGLMNFDEFYKSGKTIWMYAYGNMRWELDNMQQDRMDAQARKSFLDPSSAVARRRSRMMSKSGGGPGKGTLRKSTAIKALNDGTSKPTPKKKNTDHRRSSVRFLATMAEFDD